MKKQLYNRYSDYLQKKYNEKVYKLPINLLVTCPNRIDATGCSFCAENGTGFECLNNTLSVKEQLLQNKEYIQNRYKAKKFIAYFQNFTNTFMPLDQFKKYMYDALIDDVVEIAISTRPDCIRDDYLEVLNILKRKTNVQITIELGLQSVNYITLQKINRGHTLAEYIDAVLRIKKYNFEICTHLILNLPWDANIDVIESAKIISVLGTHQVKLHSLYIAKNTLMANEYKQGKLKIISKEEYIKRVILFLEYIDSNIVIQRLVSRAPKKDVLFCNWQTSWWVIKEQIEQTMHQKNIYQGIHFNYINGAALKKGGY